MDFRSALKTLKEEEEELQRKISTIQVARKALSEVGKPESSTKHSSQLGVVKKATVLSGTQKPKHKYERHVLHWTQRPENRKRLEKHLRKMARMARAKREKA